MRTETREEARLRLLREYQVLDTPAEPAFDAITTLAAQLFGTPLALITLVDRDRQWFKSRFGSTMSETERAASICDLSVRSGKPTVIPDTLLDSRVASNRLVTGDPGLRFYAGSPMITSEGHVLGTVCVLDLIPRALEEGQLDVLGLLADQAVALLESRRQGRELAGRLESFLNNASVPIYLKDEAGRFLLANQALHELAAAPPGSLIGRLEHDVFPPEVTAEHLRNDIEVMVNGEAIVFQEQAPDAEGHVRDYVSTKFPVPAAEGQAALIGGISVDVTSQRRLQQLVDGELQRYQALFNLAPVGILETGTDFRISRVNRTLIQLLGCSSEDTLLGRDVRELYSEADRPEIEQRLAAARVGSTDRWQHQKLMHIDDSQPVPVLVADTVLRGPMGAVQRIISVIVDITELTRTRSGLEESEQHLEAAQRLAEVGSWTYNVWSAELTLSGQLRHLLALPEQAEGSEDLLLSLVDEAERDLVKSVLNGTCDEPSPRDVTIWRWDGQRRVFEVGTEQEVDRSGKVQRTFGIMRDVTEARDLAAAMVASEARSRGLIQALPDAVLMADPGGRITEVNTATCELFGYRPQDLIGRPVEQLVPTALQGRHREHRRRYTAHAHPGPVMNAVNGLHRDGNLIPLEVVLAGLPDRDGHAVLACIRDVRQTRALQRDLERTTELFGGVLTAATEQAIIAVDTEFRINVFNSGAERMLGWRTEEMLGHTLLEFLDPEELAEVAARRGRSPGLEMLVEDALAGRTRPEEWTYLTRDGRRVNVLLTVTPMMDAHGILSGFIGVASDITERRAHDAALRESEERFRLAFDDAPIGMAMIGLTPANLGEFLQVNDAFCRITGYRAQDVVGADLGLVTHPDDATETSAACRDMAAGRLSRWSAERRYRNAAGNDVWVHVSTSVSYGADGRPAYTISQIEDITVRKDAEQELTHLALHDALTGLPNRVLLLDHLQQALARAERERSHVGVLYLDLDNFKNVNDSLGHAAGDELLVDVALHLSACLRETDTAARLGGDEFAVVCEDLADASDAVLVAARIEEALNIDVPVGEQTIHITASIGIATVDGTGQLPPPENMLRDADAAMYRAKSAGKGRYEESDPTTHARALRHLKLEVDLRKALDTEALTLAYQPCIDLRTGRVVAVEALVRWTHPEYGPLPPEEFIEVAEKRNLIVPLGAWVLRTACAQAVTWWQRHDQDAPELWVNISASQLGKAELTESVRDTLAITGLPPELLTLELTEREILGAAHSVQNDLNALPGLGVSLAIDDFGTGRTGLEYLRIVPASTLKIDKTFVQSLGSDRTYTAITTSIISLANSLDLSVVAEGVETEAQRDYLRRLGCPLAQGYLFSRPTHADRIDEMIGTDLGVT